MNCREVLPLLSLFVDGELEARQMRGVALHFARCHPCEMEVRRLEQAQESLAAYVENRVEAIDLSDLWASIEPRIGVTAPGWGARLRAWFEQFDAGWAVRAPLFAGAAAALVLSVAMWRPADEAPSVEVASIDNSAILDSVESDAGSVTLLNEP